MLPILAGVVVIALFFYLVWESIFYSVQAHDTEGRSSQECLWDAFWAALVFTFAVVLILAASIGLLLFLAPEF